MRKHELHGGAKGEHAAQHRQYADAGYKRRYKEGLRAGRLQEAVEAMVEAKTLPGGGKWLARLQRRDFLQAALRQGAVAEALQFAKAVPQQSAALWTKVAAIAARAGDVPAALEALECAKELGLADNCRLYSAVMNACARAGDSAQAHTLFQEMERRGIERDSYTFNALVTAFSARIAREDSPGRKAGLLDQAFALAELMPGEGVREPEAYNSLVVACGRAKAPDRIAEVLGAMGAAGVAQGIETCNARMRAHIDNGDGARALALFADAKAQGLAPTMKTFTLATSACLDGGGPDAEAKLARAGEIFNEALKGGGPLDGIFVAAQMSTAVTLGRADRALSLFQKLDLLLLPNQPEPFAIAADICAKAGATDLGAELFEKVLSKRVVPSVELAGALIDIFSKNADYVQAFRVLNHMLEHRVKPNTYIFSGLLYACAKAGQTRVALGLHEVAAQAGALPTSRHHLGVWSRTVMVAFLTSLRKDAHPDDVAPVTASSDGSFLYSFDAANLWDHAVEERLGMKAIERISFELGLQQMPVPWELPSRASEFLSAADYERYKLKGEFYDRLHQSNQVLKVFRGAMSQGFIPRMEDVNMALECMRIKTLRIYTDEASGLPAGFSQPVFGVGGVVRSAGGGTGPSLSEHAPLSSGGGLYKPEAFSLFEEATSKGFFPMKIKQTDLEIVIDMRDFLPVVAETSLLVILRTLQRRWNATQGNCRFKELRLIVPSWMEFIDYDEINAEAQAHEDAMDEYLDGEWDGQEEYEEQAAAYMADMSRDWEEEDEFYDADSDNHSTHLQEGNKPQCGKKILSLIQQLDLAYVARQKKYGTAILLQPHVLVQLMQRDVELTSRGTGDHGAYATAGAFGGQKPGAFGGATGGLQEQQASIRTSGY